MNKTWMIFLSFSAKTRWSWGGGIFIFIFINKTAPPPTEDDKIYYNNILNCAPCTSLPIKSHIYKNILIIFHC